MLAGMNSINTNGTPTSLSASALKAKTRGTGSLFLGQRSWMSCIVWTSLCSLVESSSRLPKCKGMRTTHRVVSANSRTLTRLFKPAFVLSRSLQGMPLLRSDASWQSLSQFVFLIASSSLGC